MNRSPYRFLAITLCVVSLLAISFNICAAAPKRCVLLVVNYLTLDDMMSDRMPNLSSAARRMGIGLLNLKTNGGYNPEKILLGLSAGAPVQVNSDGDPFLNVRESYNGVLAKELYNRFFGYSPGGLIVNPFYASLGSQNTANSEFVNDIGYLGSALHLRGGTTGLWGGSDSELDIPVRTGGLIIADSKGQIDLGGVGDIIQIADPHSPTGQRLDGAKLWSSFIAQADRTDLAVIDWGDLGVVEYWTPYLLPHRYQTLRSQRIVLIDRFFGRLFRYCFSTHRALIVLSCAVPRDPSGQERSGWAMVLHPDWNSHGFLTSASTRTPGMISPYDIHLLIDSYLGIPAPASAIGAPLRVVPGDLSALVKLNASLNNLENQRTPILIILIYFFATMIVIAAIIALFTHPRRINWLRDMLLWATLLPLAFLLSAFFRFGSIALHLLSGLFIALVLLWSIKRFLQSTVHRLEWVCLLTVIGLLGDALTGGLLSRWSVLGYSLVSGARYYGLGNEFTGILAGAALLGAGCYYQRSARKSDAFFHIGVFLTLIPLVIGFPRFGANFGDIIPMIPVFGFTLFAIGKRRPDRNAVLLFVTVFLALFTLLIWYDRSQTNPTHLGRLFQDIQSNGLRVVGLMIQRKAEMNWKLVQFSRWTILVVLVLIVFPLAKISPRAPLQRIFTRFASLRPAFIGISLAAAGGFLFNDSGIIAAATTLLIPSLSLLLLMLEENPPGNIVT